MSIRTRILLAFFIIYAVLFYFIVDFVINEIRPRYLETVEESLNDTAVLLTSLVEKELKGGRISTVALESIFNRAREKNISARIYHVRKTSLNLQIYVTDRRGIVIFDSDKGKRLGQDFSEWNDVFLTLRGLYGARSSPEVKNDPSSNSLYVAAPIRRNGKIIGVLTIVKPEKSIRLFIDLARHKVIIAGVMTCLIFIFLSIIISFWINRPILRLRNYVMDLKKQKRVPFPSLESSEIIELGHAFEDMRDELEGRKYIEQYVQSMTHELKSPLTSLMGAAELLQEDMNRDDRDRFSKNILTESRRIQEIIERLLTLSALENRHELSHTHRFSTREIFEEVRNSLEPQARKLGITLTVEDRDTIIFEGEVFLLRQSLINLVQNALQHSKAGDTVTIGAESNKTAVTFTVTDQGSGIPHYALQRVFDRFYSLPRPGKRRGTGLGLPFVKEVATLHNGTAALTNNQERGITATLTIPLIQGS